MRKAFFDSRLDSLRRHVDARSRRSNFSFRFFTEHGLRGYRCPITDVPRIFNRFPDSTENHGGFSILPSVFTPPGIFVEQIIFNVHYPRSDTRRFVAQPNDRSAVYYLEIRLFRQLKSLPLHHSASAPRTCIET